MNNVKNISVLKNGKSANNVKQNTWLGLIVIFIIGLSFFLIGGYTFLSGIQVYRMNCSHSAGYCEVLKYNLSENEYKLKHKVPIRSIQEMYLDKHKSTSNKGKTKYTYRLFLKTTKGNIDLETMYTNIGMSDRKKQVALFKNWQNNRDGNTYTYQEGRGKGMMSLIFVFIGFGLLCLLVKGFFMQRKANKQREINNPTRSENAIERM